MAKKLLSLLVVIGFFVSKPGSVLAKTTKEAGLVVIVVEEFPTEANLRRLELIDFPVNIFVAAGSIEEFGQIEGRLKKYSNVESVGYWPVLKREEGYWLSGFSKREAIKRVIGELEDVDRPISVLWDAELPHLRRRLFLTELPKLLGNRRLIRDFVTNPPENIQLYVAENRRRSILYQLVLEFFGTSFASKQEYNRIEMLYGRLDPEALEEFLETGLKLGGNYYPAFGLTAEGVGDGPTETKWMISPQKLDEQLSVAQRLGVKKVIIYRLGGLDNEYLKMIKEYVSR